MPDSVVAARGAGIRVVMITGDYLLTAIAIAKNVTSWESLVFCQLAGSLTFERVFYGLLASSCAL